MDTAESQFFEPQLIFRTSRKLEPKVVSSPASLRDFQLIFICSGGSKTHDFMLHKNRRGKIKTETNRTFLSLFFDFFFLIFVYFLRYILKSSRNKLPNYKIQNPVCYSAKKHLHKTNLQLC